ncbi:c-type cytochrome [Novosphingobium terrae]|uniref:c-type cytochrome n=1 Tax=Novosphingobium terrae TaxID=2726189 RepID=UPI00197CB692|nr:c-type cytochrome [Novosphingobium terrae]
MRAFLASLAAAGAILTFGNAGSSLHGAEAAHGRGEVLFENRCARCHGLGGDGGDGLAPPLIGVVGRNIASRSDYVYSDALKAKSGIWSDLTLNTYIADPQAFAPGADMDVNSPDPAEREAIIGYLKTLH